MQIWDRRASAYDTVAPEYERGRPSYPAMAVDQLVATLGIGPGVRVADLGAGTGKFTRLITATGAQVTAVEPIAAMRRQLRRAVPEAALVGAIAQALPFADGSLDVVTAAQSFHWFGDDRAASEIARVLNPSGSLGLIWNRRDRSLRVWDEIEQLIAPHRPARGGDWRSAIERAGLGPLHRDEFTWSYTTTADEVTLRINSMSWMAALAEPQRLDLLSQVHAIASGVADSDGTIDLTERTEVYWAQLRSV